MNEEALRVMAEHEVFASTEIALPGLDAAARLELAAAIERLKQGSGLLVRFTDAVGGVVGRTMRFGATAARLAPGVEEGVLRVATLALRQAFRVAILGLPDGGRLPERRQGRLPGTVVVLSGAAGGFFGAAGFVPDAMVTTLTIMREIARVAREEGEMLSDPDTRAACLKVFGLGATPDGPPARWAYFSARMMTRGKPLVAVLSDVAGRYGVSLSQKFAVQAVPLMGALSGAAVNSAFLNHYRNVARAHFVLRRLERRYGTAELERELATSGIVSGGSGLGARGS